MPQMMPMNWLTLYMLFILMFLLFSFINYFSLINYPALLKKQLSIKPLDWKW
uniref:ATP synthase F0 subunit 8 n=1 Tax=Blaptica dubia TaxID=132935 RepID=A0A0U2V9J6_BLADU|nr:ATP synthase F0 subunit 8 [Blaptica dubia]ALS20323.1 ATP synthase F0 subunit 8 [Blaptica dubia]AMW91030.1 ATP synthase F0 subunit 8 [Blaptica dubia]AVN67583.1 ATP synthase F0 subunit 8 [Blaptica dubia]